jgi:hypothetical protein
MTKAGLEGLNRIGLELVVALETGIEADHACGVFLLSKIGDSVD